MSPQKPSKRYVAAGLCVVGALMVVLGFVTVVLGTHSFLVMLFGVALCAGGAKVVWLGVSRNLTETTMAARDANRSNRRGGGMFVRSLQVIIYVSILVAVISALWLFLVSSKNDKLNYIFVNILIVSASVYIFAMLIIMIKAVLVILNKHSKIEK